MDDLFMEAGRLGLLADITGAILIGKSVFFVKNQDIFDTSAGFFGYSFYHTKEKIAAKYEAIVGSVFLASGFIGQYLATETVGSSKPNLKIEVCFIFFCVIILILTIYGSKKVAIWQTKKMVKSYDSKEK